VTGKAPVISSTCESQVEYCKDYKPDCWWYQSFVAEAKNHLGLCMPQITLRTQVYLSEERPERSNDARTANNAEQCQSARKASSGEIELARNPGISEAKKAEMPNARTATPVTVGL
jgi:hypothetical protein